MALGHKLTLFFVCITVYLAKTQDYRNQYPPFDFKSHQLFPKYTNLQNNTELPPVITIPDQTIPPRGWVPPNPCIRHSSHIFSFSNVGLQKIGRDFINSHDIISLSLDNNDINDISPFAFRNMRHLQNLDLSGNKIPKEKLLSLVGTAKLQVLIIDNNRDSHNPVPNILKEHEIFSNLKYLHLCNSQLGNFQMPFYVATPTLTHLLLSNNSINSSDVVFDNIPATLTHLYLNKNSIDRVKQGKLRYTNVYEIIFYLVIIFI